MPDQFLMSHVVFAFGNSHGRGQVILAHPAGSKACNYYLCEVIFMSSGATLRREGCIRITSTRKRSYMILVVANNDLFKYQ